MTVGFCRLRLALVAANALLASSTANPMTTLLEIVANFIAAPFFLSRRTLGKRLGRPWFATGARKHLSFRTNRIECCRWGPTDKSQACSAAMGVFSTGPPSQV